MHRLSFDSNSYCEELPFTVELVKVQMTGKFGESKRHIYHYVRIKTPDYKIVAATKVLTADHQPISTHVTVVGPEGHYLVIAALIRDDIFLERGFKAETEDDVRYLTNNPLPEPVAELQLWV